MIIPTRRFLWLAALPLAVVVGGRGGPGAISAAWCLMGGLLAAFLVDGTMAGRRPRFRLSRETPGQLHVEQPDRISWLVENRGGFPLVFVLAAPAAARAPAHPPPPPGAAPPPARTAP